MTVRIAALGCSTLLAGCFMSVSVPDVPSTARPDLPPDKFLELDAHTETVEVNYKVKTGETCYKGDCVTHRENRSKDVDVRVASGTIDGRPVSIRELAVMASPDFVRDTDKVQGLMSACRRGRISMGVGLTAAIAGVTMMTRAFDEDNPNRTLAIAGYGVLGVAALGLIGGRYAFGGQHCREAGAIYERWEPIYKDPNDTKLAGEAAEMYEVLAKKFNADREASSGRQSSLQLTTEVTP